MLLPQLLQCRRQSLHLFLHNLGRLKVDTAPVKVLVVVVALVDVDVADAGDGVDEVDEVLPKARPGHQALAHRIMLSSPCAA